MEFFLLYNEHGFKKKYKEKYANDKHQIQKSDYLWLKERKI